MALKKVKTLKVYYSISEVAELLGEPETTIKYWEQEFTHIKPRRSPTSGSRQYRERDIEAMRVVKKLIRDKGLTIQGAKSVLSQKRSKLESREEALTRLRSALGKLKELDEQLRSQE